MYKLSADALKKLGTELSLYIKVLQQKRGDYNKIFYTNIKFIQ